MPAGTVVEQDDDEGTTWWEAEKVVASRIRNGTKQYRVRWVGCSKAQDTWEPEENLADSLYELAEKYDAIAGNRRKPIVSSQRKPRKKQKLASAIERRNNREAWTIPEGNTGTTAPSVLSFGLLRVDSLRHKSVAPLSFASHYFGRRLFHVEIPLKRGGEDIPPKQTSFDGYSFSLLSSRVPRDTKSGKTQFHDNQKIVRLTYVATSGPGLSTISLQKKLDAIADFESLSKVSPHKAKARLELLESGTSEGLLITELTKSDFKVVKEQGNLGCGFIPLSVLETLGFEKTNCLQVRVIAPQLGVFKGVLCPKQGIDCIELPRSMQKVGPSKAKPRERWVCMLVKQTFPTSKNVQLGRQLDHSSQPSLSYFKRDRSAGDMIERLWKSLGVPQRTFISYARRCNKKDSIRGLKHAYLLGVADPTGNLPEGTVFVPGLGRESRGNHDKVFITRSPCVESSDGRLVPVVDKRPRTMSRSDWEWINTFSFGIVIFGSFQDKATPLPELIAGGDLDGDTYLVCWDKGIVASIESNAFPFSSVNAECTCGLVQSSRTPERRGNWLSDSQDVMLDIEWLANVKAINGRLWGAAKRAADNSIEYMNDPAAVQLAKAYKLSLDLAKRGGQLSVPEDVRNVLRSHFTAF